MIALDLFAGAGGLSAGLSKAGFSVKAAVEVDPIAAKTYRTNHPDTELLEGDICKVSPSDLLRICGGNVSLLAGCAPCQGFCSLTAKNKKADPRNLLILQMATLISEIKPQAVLMENVPGLETRGRDIFADFLKQLDKAGYHVRLKDGSPAWRVIQMADYGVPQSRRRLVLLAGRGFDITFPEPTHSKNPSYGSGLKNWLTLRHVIGREKPPITLRESRKAGGPLKHRWHVVSDLTSAVAARLTAAIPGKTWLQLDEAIRPKCHKGDYKGFTNVYGRMSWEQTPVTMTAGCTTPCKGRFGHPDKTRTTISVREAALIQTFSKRYKFATDEMEAACRMIGNAVPPLFAYILATHIRGALKRQNGTARCDTGLAEGVR